MTYEMIHTYIPIKFEELKAKYLIELQDSTDDDGILNYILFPAVFHQYVNDLLRDNTDTMMLNRIFEFYEDMAINGDDKVKTLLQVGLLECLWDEKLVYDNSQQYMKSETMKLFDNVGFYLRIPEEPNVLTKRVKQPKKVKMMNILPLYKKIVHRFQK